MKRLLVLIAVLSAISGAAQAAERGGLAVELTAQRIVVEAGKESRTSADLARPGEIIEYRATYTNTGLDAAKNVAATLPIPAAGLEYLPQTGSPRIVLASLDGKTFEPVPLKREVRLTDGTRQLVDVPFTEYRFLRWSLGDLAAGATTTVAARMRVIDSPALGSVQ